MNPAEQAHKALLGINGMLHYIEADLVRIELAAWIPDRALVNAIAQVHANVARAIASMPREIQDTWLAQAVRHERARRASVKSVPSVRAA